MQSLNEHSIRILIGNFFKENMNKPKSFTVNHFLQMGMRRSTIYDIIKRVENNIPLKRLTGSGRKPFKMTV